MRDFVLPLLFYLDDPFFLFFQSDFEPETIGFPFLSVLEELLDIHVDAPIFIYLSW